MVFMIWTVEVDAVPAGGEEDLGAEAKAGLGWETGKFFGGGGLETHVGDGSLGWVGLIESAVLVVSYCGMG
jgi:hypothetical protein